MNLLAVENITKSYGVKNLFSDITFGIEQGDKIGLIGINGTGKSSMLKVLAGIETPDQGRVVAGNAVRVEYLPQNPVFDDQASVLQQVFRGSTPSATDIWQAESEAKTILTRLGIYDFDAKMGTLSGGQRKRIALAGALINPAELLILDEPTNHIDNETVDWLEQYLNRRKGALLMITHDRYFLDRVVNRILELDRGRLFGYTGNYSKFLEQKMLREEQEQATEQKRLNLWRNELAWIKRGAKARTTKQKARIDRFAKLEAEKPQVNADRLEISAVAGRLGKKVVSLAHISKSFAGSKLIDDFSCNFMRADRVGIIGPNGIGKSTLLNIIAGRSVPDCGTVDIGQTVKVGYFSQESREMDESLKVIDFIREQAEFLTTAEGRLISAAQMLQRFLFPPEIQWTPIARISGGERRRLQLLRILMSAPNMLLLDEPTNDLDIQTLTILEDYLDEFPGAVLAVSHDRYFLDRVTDKILAFTGNGRIINYLGNYSDYIKQAGGRGAAGPDNGDRAGGNKADGNKAGEKLGDHKAGAEKSKAAGEKKKPLKFSFKEQREYEQIDEIIATAEQELREVNTKINEAGSDFVVLQELLDVRQGLEKRLDELLERWAYLHELAEAIAQNKNDIVRER